jgi:hypothetical protein
MSAGTTIVGFLKDQDGYEIELLSKKFWIQQIRLYFRFIHIV